MLDINGQLIDTFSVPRPSYPNALYTETLHVLDDSSFLLMEDIWNMLGESPNPTIRKFQVNGNSLTEVWKIDVGGGAANKPLVVQDVDGDGFNDFIVRTTEGESLALLSGQAGNIIYPIHISAMYVRAGCMIDDIDGDGIREIALGPCTSNHSHGLYICSLKKDNATPAQINGIDLFESLSSIQDINGDGFSEIIGITTGGKIECYSGFDSRIISEFSIYILLTTISLMLIFVLAIKKRAPAPHKAINNYKKSLKLLLVSLD